MALLVLLVSGHHGLGGAFGMFFSSITERTLAATIRSYTVAIAVTVGLPVVAGILFQNAYGNVVNSFTNRFTNDPAVEATTIYLDMIATSLNPIMATLRSQQMLIDHQQLVTMRVTLASNGASIPVLSPWVLLTLSYLSATALLVLISIRRMERQSG